MKTQKEAIKTTDGLTKENIEAWKAQHGKIFKTIVDGDSYVWRKLKRKEYTEIMSVKAEPGEEMSMLYERQEKITKLVTLFPANIEEAVENNAGLATTISDEVILKSGFDIGTTEAL